MQKNSYENEQAEHISMLVVSHEGKRKLGNGLLKTDLHCLGKFSNITRAVIRS